MSVLLGSELNSLLIYLFEKRISTVILATTDKNHHPHTAPFNCIIAQDVKHLRLAISKEHQTYQNINERSPVALAVLEEGDVAVCIKGLAKVIRDNMFADYNMAIIEIEIVEIKKDNSPNYMVSQGIRARHKNELSLFNSRKIFQELSEYK